MYRLLIVDDESWIRKGLKKMIEWEQLGIDLIGETDDGVKALEIAKELKPDVIISDVRMPSMDGLTLSERIIQYFPQVKIIIISGYDEFEYVKRAINFEAVSYILKPVDKSELNNVLRKAISKVEKSRQHNDFKENADFIIEKWISEIIKNESEETFQELNERFADRFFELNYACVVLVQPLWISNSLAELEKCLKRIVNIVKTNNDQDICFFNPGNNKIGMFFVIKSKNYDFENYLRKIIIESKNENTCDFHIGIGEVVESIRHIKKSYLAAINALGSRDINSSRRVLYNTAESTSHRINKLPYELQKKLIDYMLINNKQAICSALEEIRRYFCESEMHFTIRNARQFFLSLAGELSKLIRGKQSCENEITSKIFDFCSRIEHYNSFEDLVHWLETYCLIVANVLNEGSIDARGVVNRMVEYVNERYNKDLTLTSVSKLFGINHCYASTLFKEKTGKNFVDFVNDLRINRAIELLKNINVRVEDISELVGYKDSKYFCKLFKAVTGSTPTQYRKMVSNHVYT